MLWILYIRAPPHINYFVWDPSSYIKKLNSLTQTNCKDGFPDVTEGKSSVPHLSRRYLPQFLAFNPQGTAFSLSPQQWYLRDHPTHCVLDSSQLPNNHTTEQGFFSPTLTLSDKQPCRYAGGHLPLICSNSVQNITSEKFCSTNQPYTTGVVVSCSPAGVRQ